MITTRIPITATEPFIIFILPISEEYASLIDEPITGISEPRRNLIPLTDTLSIEAANMLFMLRKPENKDAIKPSVKVNILFNDEIIFETLIALLSEKDMLREKNTPNKSVIPVVMT